MNIVDFQTLFSESIRAMLSWQRLLDANPPIDTIVTADLRSLGELRTVWYRDADGGPGDWKQPDHAPLTVAEAATTPRSWTTEKRDKIEGLRRHFLTYPEPNQLLLPCYRTQGEYLLLDASHRTVAAFLAGKETRALMLVVSGPTDHAILADLDRASYLSDSPPHSTGLGMGRIA